MAGQYILCRLQCEYGTIFIWVDEDNNIYADFIYIFQILSAIADLIKEKNSFFKPKQTIYILFIIFFWLTKCH